jgi:nuclease S1
MRSKLLAGILVFLPLPALAWGPEGHEIVAHIAARELTPRARAQVAALLGGPAEAMMVTGSNWADEIRDARPETTAWHFVDIELDRPGYQPARDCPQDDCVVAQINKQRAIVADGRQPRARRAEALLFLIHFVGDVHQPLHAIDDHDRGGNEIRVRLGERRTNMHHVWDTNMVEALGDNAADISAAIAGRIPPAQKTAWQAGTPANWADETFGVARHEIYDQLGPGGRYRQVFLPRGYFADETPLVRGQLAKAGFRLGWLINQTLR